MIDQVTALAAEAVARELAVQERQVARAGLSHSDDVASNGGSQTAQHVAMRQIDRPQVWVTIVGEYDGIHQTTRAGENRSAAAGAAHDRHAVSATIGYIDFTFNVRRGTYDHEGLRWLPDAQQFAGTDRLLGVEQQRLVECEILCGRAESEINKVQGSKFKVQKRSFTLGLYKAWFRPTLNLKP